MHVRWKTGLHFVPMVPALKCWKCSAVLDELLLPLARLAECPTCSTDLHVCVMCRFYDTSVADACREPVAEPVSDKRRANFCGYLELRSDHGPDVDAGADAAAKDLGALFGLEQAQLQKPSPQDELRDLFGLPDDDRES